MRTDRTENIESSNSPWLWILAIVIPGLAGLWFGFTLGRVWA